MKGFSGFPSGKMPTTPVPNLFFSEVMPQIDHQAELKVTLYCFWRLSLKEGRIRYLLQNELLADDTLVAGLANSRDEAESLLTDSLERACARGTFLRVALENGSDDEKLYFLNTPKGRAAVDSIKRGEWSPRTDTGTPTIVEIERPNIFILYEQNIGPLTPLIADELRDAEDAYPSHWLEDAFRLAVQNNARSWRYVLAILERWQTEGRDDRTKFRGNTEKSRRRYLDYLK